MVEGMDYVGVFEFDGSFRVPLPWLYIHISRSHNFPIARPGPTPQAIILAINFLAGNNPVFCFASLVRSFVSVVKRIT
jgi:hypothetical protein